MVTLYSGIPGSGKSYRMVYDLIKQIGLRFIIHNIEGFNNSLLKGHGFNFVEYCQKQNPPMEVPVFFSKEVQEQICKDVKEKYGLDCLVIIDEAHEWFDKQVKSLKMWLSFHRHLGQDVWLVAHRSSNIPSVYRSYIEVEYRGKTSSLFFLPGRFMYQKISGGTSIGYDFRKKKQEVFQAYKSQSVGAPKNRRSFMIPVFIVLAVLVFGGFFFLPVFLYGNKAKPVTDQKGQKGPVSTLAGPGSAPNGAQPSATMIKSIADQFAFCGVMGDKLIFENRSTGESLPLSRLPGVFLVMMFSGSDSATLFDTVAQKTFTFTNSNRAQTRQTERSGSAGGVGVDGVSVSFPSNG